jgi:hypothetical protein
LDDIHSGEFSRAGISHHRDPKRFDLYTGGSPSAPQAEQADNMKSTLDDVFAKQMSPRGLMPAEACSELGLAPSGRADHMTRLARWIRLVRRWLIDHYSSAHG